LGGRLEVQYQGDVLDWTNEFAFVFTVGQAADGSPSMTVGGTRVYTALGPCATANLDEVTDVQARVNGNDVANLDSYRISSPPFNLTVPEGNMFGLEPGVAQAVTADYSFIIAPPPPGEHEIAWTARFPDQPEPPPLATIIVTVEAPRMDEPPPTT